MSDYEIPAAFLAQENHTKLLGGYQEGPLIEIITRKPALLNHGKLVTYLLVALS